MARSTVPDPFTNLFYPCEGRELFETKTLSLRHRLYDRHSIAVRPTTSLSGSTVLSPPVSCHHHSWKVSVPPVSPGETGEFVCDLDRDVYDLPISPPSVSSVALVSNPSTGFGLGPPELPVRVPSTRTLSDKTTTHALGQSPFSTLVLWTDVSTELVDGVYDNLVNPP